jgi:hypothetical protein
MEILTPAETMLEQSLIPCEIAVVGFLNVSKESEVIASLFQQY